MSLPAHYYIIISILFFFGLFLIDFLSPVQQLTRTCTHTCKHAHAHTRTYTLAHIVHTRTLIQSHAYTHSDTYTHTTFLMCEGSLY